MSLEMKHLPPPDAWLREYPDGRLETYRVDHNGAHPPTAGGFILRPVWFADVAVDAARWRYIRPLLDVENDYGDDEVEASARGTLWLTEYGDAMEKRTVAGHGHTPDSLVDAAIVDPWPRST